MIAAIRGTSHRGLWRLAAAALAALLLATAASAATSAADSDLAPADAAAQRVENVIAAARQYLGAAYRVGSEGPSQFDCSGLVFRAFSDASLVDRIGGNRLRAAGYMRWFGRQGLMTTNEEEAQRGDLVVYDRGRHIGIYLGNGRTISALLSGVAVHSLHGISQEVTGFLRPDWSGNGEVAPFVPVELPDVIEQPALLVPASDWAGGLAAEDVTPIAREGTERADLRTASTRTFENGDGTFTTEFHAQPIHYLSAKSEQFEAIDLRFAVNDRQPFPTVTRSPVRLTARPATDADGLLSASAGGSSISMALPDGAGSEAEPTLVDDGRVVDYHDLLPGGVGLRVMATADGFRGFLVLTRRPDAGRFTFALDAPGLTAALDESGAVLLSDDAGAVVARIPRPKLLDSSDSDGLGGGLEPGAASFELTVGDDGTLLTLVVRPRFLAEAAYPAYLDLALTGFPAATPAADVALISSRDPDAALGTFARPEAAGASELVLGRQPRTRHETQALLRFTELRSTLGTVDVAAASLELLPYLQRDESVAALVSRVNGPWAASAVTWSSRPLVGGQVGTLLGASGQWQEIDVSEYVTDTLSRGAADDGLLLGGEEDTAGTWKRVVIGEHGPRLVVTWSGLRPTAIAGNADALAWTLPALAGAHDRFELELSRDGFATVGFATGPVKGRAGRATEWTLPASALAEGGSYEWRVRVRLAGRVWSEWSVPATLSAIRMAPTYPPPARELPPL